MLAGFHISGTRSHPASGSRPDIVAKLLRPQTSIEIRSESWEILGEAFINSTDCRLPKQPDKARVD
jgi:hypothetical protein